MDIHTIAELADRLIAAEESRTPIEVPSIAYPGMTVADGYAVQRAISTNSMELPVMPRRRQGTGVLMHG